MARLYTEYGYFLFRRCLTYLGDTAAAHDAVQEVFVRALRGAGQYRGEAAPRTWLSRIADHLCVDLLRRQRRNPVRAAIEVEPELEVCVDADDGEALLSVRHLMAQLDPEAQRLAVLYYIDELTQEELAQELGLSRRTIGKRLQALLVQARALLQPEQAS